MPAIMLIFSTCGFCGVCSSVLNLFVQFSFRIPYSCFSEMSQWCKMHGGLRKRKLLTSNNTMPSGLAWRLTCDISIGWTFISLGKSFCRRTAASSFWSEIWCRLLPSFACGPSGPSAASAAFPTPLWASPLPVVWLSPRWISQLLRSRGPSALSFRSSSASWPIRCQASLYGWPEGLRPPLPVSVIDRGLECLLFC